MHSTALAPAGKAVELETRDDGEYIKAKVVEPGAVKLTEEGVYSAFSIGLSRARVVTDPVAKGGRIVDGIVTEVSLVDYPANPTCKFAVTKAASIAVEDGVERADEWADVGEHELVDEAHKAVIADVTKSTPEVEHLDLTGTGETSAAKPEDQGAGGEEAEEVVEPAEPVEVPEVMPVEEPEGTPPAEEPPAAAEETVQLAEAAAAVVDEAPKAITPDALKSLHDAICPHASTVEKAAPSGVNAEMLQAVHAALLAELAEDGGTGSEAWDISWLADLYCDLVCWAQDEAWDEIWDELLASAHDPDITKAADDDKRAQLAKAIRGAHEAIAKGHPEFCEALKGAAPAPTLEADVAKIVELAVAKAMAERDTQIAELTDEVIKLGGQPDPEKAPFRGGTGGTEPVRVVEETSSESTTETVTKARTGGDVDEEKGRYIAYLNDLTKSPDLSIREAARAELEKLASGPAD